MAQLWGGRFTKETDQLVYNFNASISFDKRFYKQDIRGSIAHVTMLEKQGILTKEEKDQIIEGLESICRDVENKTLEITEEYEDNPQLCRSESDRQDRRCGEKITIQGESRNDTGRFGYEALIREIENHTP